MSNLSDLLPAGAGGKQVNFVASGTLASGQTVGLKTDGTVEAISVTGGSPSAVAGVVFESAVVQRVSATYDSTNSKVVVGYKDVGNSDYGTAVIGTVSGTTITFATPVVFEAASTDFISLTFDSANNKVIIAYKDGGNSSYPTAIVGTVSGTSISFGTAVVIYSGGSLDTVCTYDSSKSKVFFVFSLSSSYIGRGSAGTVSGTSITFAAGTELVGTSMRYASLTFDNSLNKTILSFSDTGNSNYGTSCVVTLSGASNNQISFGAKTVFSGTSEARYTSSTFDSNSNKVVIAYQDYGSSSHGKAVVGTASGTTISFGSPVTFNAGNTGWPSAVFDTNINKVVLAYSDVGNSANNYGTVVNGTVSGTSISFSSPLVFEAANTNYIGTAFDSTTNQVIIPFQDGGNGDYGTAAVYTAAGSNNTSFIGITDAAISSGASGSVTIKGGVITNTGLIPIENISFGSISSPASQGLFNSRMTYDSASNRIVLAYEDATNSNYGTAVVGTVSGTSVTWGTPVVFNSASTADGSIDVVYDPDSNKSIIAYRDLGNSGHGTAIVGTVSGTAISFGAESVFSTKSSYYINITYDTSQDKVLIVYLDGGDSYKGYMVVGTVNGGANTISFGSEVQFESSTVGGSALSVCYDASATKSLLVYYVGTADYAASITISGTTPSIGTKNNWANVGYRNTQSVYVASSSACVIVYNNNSGNKPVSSNIVAINSGSGNVTVNGSNSAISSTSLNERALVYDVSSASLIYVYNSYPSGSNVLSSILGKISGTSITWSDTTVVNSTSYSGNAPFPSMAYDSTNNKSVIAWRAAADSQSLVATIAATTPLIIGTDYYVQSNGTLSTTSSSVLAGRALSSTSINLDYTT